MLKKSSKLYTQFLLTILSLILFLPTAKLFAHSPTKSPWLYINATAITDEMENNVPNPSKIEWAEHIYNTNLSKGDNLKASVDRDVIERDLKVTKDNIKVTYKLDKPDQTSQNFDNDFTLNMESTGNYFLDISVNKKDNNDLIISESIMIIVGSEPPQAKMSVNGQAIDVTSASPTFSVTDNFDLKFEVTNIGDYNYTWDLGTGETKEGTNIEYSFDKAKIPVYVILRTQNKVTKEFIDSFVRIDSPRENSFGIPKPPVKIPPSESNSSSNIIGIVLLIVVLIAVAYFVYRKKNVKNK